MNRITRFSVAWIASVLAISLPATAQESGANVSVGNVQVDGLTIGETYVFDNRFAQKYEVAVPAPFRISIPSGPDHEIFVAPAPGGTGIVKAFFLNADEQVRSNIQFLPMTIDKAEPAQRLEWARPLLQQVFNNEVPEGVQNAVDGVRVIEGGTYPAIELVGRYDGGDAGVVILRIVAIPKPDSEDGIIAVILGSAQVLGIKDVVGIYTTLASQTLDSFHFQ